MKQTRAVLLALLLAGSAVQAGPAQLSQPWEEMTPAQRAGVWDRIDPASRRQLWLSMAPLERIALKSELRLLSARPPSGRERLPWESMHASQRAAAWAKMPAEDRQFYWRRMSVQDRREMRACQPESGTLLEVHDRKPSSWRSTSAQERAKRRLDVFRQRADELGDVPPTSGPGIRAAGAKSR